MIICKHCGQSEGFYTKQQVHGVAEICYSNEGHVQDDNGRMHDHLYYSGGKNAYCNACDRILGKSEELISGEREENIW